MIMFSCVLFFFICKDDYVAVDFVSANPDQAVEQKDRTNSYQRKITIFSKQHWCIDIQDARFSNLK